MGTWLGERISIALVIDDPVVLSTLQSLLERRYGFCVVWASQKGKDAVTRCLTLAAPDVVIVDMSLEDMNGVDVCRKIHVGNDKVALLAITSHPKELYTAQAEECGAQGIVEMINTNEIATTARLLVQEKSIPYLSWGAGPPFDTADCGSKQEDGHRSLQRPEHLPALGPREIQVLELAIRGYDQNEISAHLNISAPTVRTYTKRVREKLHCRTLAQATAEWVSIRDAYRPFAVYGIH